MSKYIDDFWSYVKHGGPDGCWVWQGPTLPSGYGVICAGRSTVYAHRKAWELHYKMPVPGGRQIRHRCDNPPCCNPAHLVSGEGLDNMADMVERGRAGWYDQDATLPANENPKDRASIERDVAAMLDRLAGWLACLGTLSHEGTALARHPRSGQSVEYRFSVLGLVRRKSDAA